ncbi:hypothetical protein LCGC14_1040930 [marine sediment metagenome]|uniref:Uncharacterized protein n=1 Tax=marine sediment metagenome TaxID=412755 RepID=A0A0F9MRL2_9ZZZZ
MSEKNLKINEIQIANRENSRLIRLAETNAGMSKANVSNYKHQIAKAQTIHKLRIKELRNRLRRAVDNTKLHIKTIDELIENKEVLHDQLKVAFHLGEVQCNWCHKYFTPVGITRHKATCAMKPKKRVVRKSKKAIDSHKKDQIVRKKSLEKEVVKVKIKK